LRSWLVMLTRRTAPSLVLAGRGAALHVCRPLLVLVVTGRGATLRL